MIDLHSHNLPGVDDGARTLEESLEIARAAVEDGIELIAATPHVRHDYPTPVATMEQLVRRLKAAFWAEGIALELRTGGEIALEQLDVLSPAQLRRFGLAAIGGSCSSSFRTTVGRSSAATGSSSFADSGSRL